MESRKIVGSAEQAGAIAYLTVSLTIIIFADNNRRVIDKLEHELAGTVAALGRGVNKMLLSDSILWHPTSQVPAFLPKLPVLSVVSAWPKNKAALRAW